MTHPTSPIEVGEAYWAAAAAGDFDALEGLLNDKVVVLAPVGEIPGAKGYRQFWEDFAKTVSGLELVKLYGDEDSALVFYNSMLGEHRAPVTELLEIRDGTIVRSHIVFDTGLFARLSGGAAI